MVAAQRSLPADEWEPAAVPVPAAISRQRSCWRAALQQHCRRHFPPTARCRPDPRVSDACACAGVDADAVPAAAAAAHSAAAVADDDALDGSWVAPAAVVAASGATVVRIAAGAAVAAAAGWRWPHHAGVADAAVDCLVASAKKKNTLEI